ncbi:MAG: GNVR domain-containing protein [Firmicutes bacterium]|nr:GNVR domain-containing protein [Bacillota bacterium]MDD4263045.1 GNVR domain-containing protein [Bacillota bacterium]MDD4692806.1 GNVR domain-containing protein [Bacillota bacterium]
MELELIDFINILKKYWYLIIGLTLVAAIIAGVLSSLMPPIYEADARILIREGSGAGLSSMLFGDITGQTRNEIQNSVEILKSRTLSYNTAQLLSLDFELGTEDLNSFRKSFSVQPVQGTDFIRITYQSEDPVFAKNAVNALVDAFIESSLLYNREEARSARDFIEQQLSTLEETLSSAENSLSEFKGAEKIIDPSEEAKAIINKITTYDVSRSEATVSMRELEAKLDELFIQLEKETNTYISSQVIGTNPLVTNIKSQLVAKETELQVLLTKSTPGSREVKNLEKEIETLKNQLNLQVEQIVTSQTETTNPLYQQLIVSISQTQSSITALEARISALTELIKSTEKEFDNLPEKEIELARLTRDFQVTESIYTMLLQTKEEYRIQEAMQSANIQVVDRAITPDSPVSPRKKMNVAVASFLGLFLAAMLAFLFEYLDNTIITKQDVEEYLELTVLAAIPEIASEGGESRGKKKSKRN